LTDFPERKPGAQGFFYFFERRGRLQTEQGIRMELKYCECCGGLLLRRAGSGAMYCGECAVLIGDLAPRRERGQRKQVKQAAPPREDWPEQTRMGLRLEASMELAVPQPPQPAVFAPVQLGAA